jgi:hypothetical protein
MGDVDRAKGTRFCPEMAIKVLPEHFADGRALLWRFECDPNNTVEACRGALPVESGA